MRRTIKSEFRRFYGRYPEHKCKECRFFRRYTANRSYYKCVKMGVTSSPATDIRLNDDSCWLFEAAEMKMENYYPLEREGEEQ